MAADPIQPARQRSAVMIQHLEPGTRLTLVDGREAEVTTNPRDGSWLFVRFSADGDEELVFVNDVLAVAE
jgi:hypothetical protein